MESVLRTLKRMYRRFNANLTISLSICVGAVLLVVLVGVLLSLRGKPEKSAEDTPVVENNAIDQLFQKYYDAYAAGDMNTLRTILDLNNQGDEIEILVKSSYIESFTVNSCIVKDGIEPNTYLAFVSYDMKLYETETKIPGMTAFLVTVDANGNMTMSNKSSLYEATKAYYESVAASDIAEMANKVQLEYSSIFKNDPEATAALQGFLANAKKEMGERMAQLTAEQNGTEVPVAQTEEEAVEPDTQTPVKSFVKTTSSVNVRSSDSTNAEKVGKAPAGSIYECVEKQVNGWTKIIFEGRSAFIKAEFLEDVADTASAAGAKVVVTENVKIRKSPSVSADVLGGASAGESFTVIEKRDDGWTKIMFNGIEAYVKSDYVK